MQLRKVGLCQVEFALGRSPKLATKVLPQGRAWKETDLYIRALGQQDHLPLGGVKVMVRIHRPLPIEVRRQSVAARGVLLEPDNVFIVRRDVVVPVPVQVPGRIVGPWVEPAVAFHVPVTKRNG